MIDFNIHIQKINRNVSLASIFLSAFIVSLILIISAPSSVAAREVSVEETCQIPVNIIANVPERIQKGKSFRLTNLVIKPSNTYGVTISSSLTELSASNTDSSTFNQDFLRTDPSPTTGNDFYTAFYPDWVINATGEVGSEIEIKLKGSVSLVGDLGEIACTYTKTLAVVPIVAEATDDLSNQPSSNPSVVAFRLAVLDSYGRPIKDARVKIGNLEKTTDKDGQVLFTNVLSGKKLITAIDGKDRIQGEYTVSGDFTVGAPAITLRKNAPPLYQNPFFIGGVSVSLLLLIAVGVVVIRKRSKDVPREPLPSEALQGIIQGSLSARQSVPIIIPGSDQPTNTNTDRVVSPAPWHPPVSEFPAPIPPSQPAPNPPVHTSDTQLQMNPNLSQTPLTGAQGTRIPVTVTQSETFTPSPETPLPTQTPSIQVSQPSAPNLPNVDAASSISVQNPPTIPRPPVSQ